MADQQTSKRGSSGIAKPVVAGILLIVGFVAAIYFRGDLGHLVRWIGRIFGSWVTDWVPAHPSQAGVIVAFAVVALIINWVAHVRGRLRAWIFALIVEVGMWLLFWYGLAIPSFNDLLGLHVPRMAFTDVLLFGLVVIGLTGVVFWFLELREEWKKLRSH